MNGAGGDDSWRTSAFRNNVVQKIDEAIQKAGTPTNKSSMEMENHVYQKAKNKDDYLSYVARLILHIREMNSTKKGQMSGQQMQPGQPMQDPMNALRAMAHPGGGNQMMSLIPQQGTPQLNASNLLQTLNQRPNLQNNRTAMQPGVMGQMPNPLGPVQQGQMHGGPMGNQVNISMANQMNASVNSPVANITVTGPGPMGNPNSMTGPMVSGGSMGMAGQIGSSMGPMPGQMGNVPMGQQVPSPMQGGMPPNQMNMAQMNHLAAQRKMVPDGMMIPNQANIAYIPRGPVPNNSFLRQNTPPPQPSPAGMNPVYGGSMVPSPALVPSPNTAQMPTPGGMVGPMLRQSGPGMAPSPGSNITLNTPGNQSQPTPSPCSNDEQAYRDKVKQLSRYIEPLRKMISRLGNGDSEKMGKMKKLLEILSSPGQKITLETLLKCEVVLEKLDIKQPETQTKEQHPLLEAISAALQSPNPNHTFQRTFEPIMTTLNGKPLKNLPKPLKRKQIEETPGDIPEVLQGEVARLDQRFKVSLDPVQQNTSKSVHLICWLDDRHLPCIPPVQITIPDDYPASSPKCFMSNYECGATKFLQMIQNALQARISKLPARFTVSQLLDTWEMSVRETCSADRVSF